MKETYMRMKYEYDVYQYKWLLLFMFIPQWKLSVIAAHELMMAVYFGIRNIRVIIHTKRELTLFMGYRYFF